MIAVVVRTYTHDRLGLLSRYLTHGARHLAAETYDGSPFGDALGVMAEPNPKRRDGLLLTHMAISLAKHERGTPDMMFEAGRAFIDEMQLQHQPWISVLHGPPDDAHLHLHLVVRLDDKVTGEVQPLARLPRTAFAAATSIAGRYGWDAPPRDNHDRRREPRAARSVGVWHGERSLHSWVGEIAGPRMLPRIDAATSWAEVAAALADFGLRYERTERGAVIEDCSRTPTRKVPASALAFRASANALEKRFGPAPDFPIPDDAERNPRAFANDAVGRSTGVGTPAERRAFAAEHATWTAVWLPVRREQLDAQRAVESERKAALAQQVAKMRLVRDELAQNRMQWLVANRFIRAYRAEAGADLRARARAERGALADLPFARRPPSRLLEWLRQRNATPTETRILHAPARNDAARPMAPNPYRLEPGLAGQSEWWTERRRVAVDRGSQIVICDPACLPDALAEAEARWRNVRIGGDQPFRDAALAAAAATGVAVAFDRRPDEPPALPVMAPLPGHVGSRRAMAIGRHLGVREMLLDGQRVRADVAGWPDQGARTLELASADALVINATSARVAQMESADIVPAVTVGETAVFAIDRSMTSGERAEVTRALVDAYSVTPRRGFSLEGPIRYGPPGMCEGLRRLLMRLRPQPRPASFAERVRAIQSFLDAFVPEERELSIVATPAPRKEQQTRTRKRASRSR